MFPHGDKVMSMNTTHKPEMFDKVEEYLHNARLVAFDGCHKIYLAMDKEEAEWFESREDYQKFYGSPDEMLATVILWYEESCFLRFVNAVFYNEDDPNAGFVSLIGQFEDEDEDEYEDEYEDEDEDDE